MTERMTAWHCRHCGWQNIQLRGGLPHAAWSCPECGERLSFIDYDPSEVGLVAAALSRKDEAA